MKKCLSLCLLFILAVCTVQCAFASESPTVDFSFDKSSVSVGETLTVNYEITEGADYSEIEINWIVLFDDFESWMSIQSESLNPQNRKGTSSVTVPYGHKVLAELLLVEDDGRDEVNDPHHIIESKTIPVTGYAANTPSISITADKTFVGAGESVTLTYSITGSKGEAYNHIQWECLSVSSTGRTTADCMEFLAEDTNAGQTGSITVSPTCGKYLIMAFDLTEASGRDYYSIEKNTGVQFTGDTCKRPDVQVTFSPDPIPLGSNVNVSFTIPNSKAYKVDNLDFWVTGTYSDHNVPSNGSTTEIKMSDGSYKMVGNHYVKPDLGGGLYFDMTITQDTGKKHYFSWIEEGKDAEYDDRFFVPIRGYVDGYDTYAVTQGNGQTANGDADLTFIANGSHSKFDGIMLDGTFYPENQYADSAVAGGTKVVLYKEFLSALKNGSHELAIVFEDGVAAANFTIEFSSTDDSPIMPDGSNIVSGKCGDNAYWSLDKDLGILTISGTDKMYDYNSIWTDQESPWYEDRLSILSVYIQEGITTIGTYAFESCTNLTNITIPDSVKEIKGGAFYYCGFSNFTIPTGITSISSSLFAGCNNLISVTIPEGVTQIGYCAFAECTKLTAVDLPNSINTIGVSAFSGCSGLHSLTLPANLTSIESHAFERCSNLDIVSFPQNLQHIGSSAFSQSGITNILIPNDIFSISTAAFSSCHNLKSISLPNNLSSIGYQSFLGCSSLTNIIIPEKVTTISIGAFSYCNVLDKVYFKGNAPEIDSRDNTPLIIDLTPQFNKEIVTLYYIPGKTGWTDSEAYDAEAGTWHGYKLATWNGVNEPTEQPPQIEETAKPLSQLNDIDFLAFADVAYHDAPDNGQPLKSIFTHTWDLQLPWPGHPFTLNALYRNIANWEYIHYPNHKNDASGFYAMTFGNDTDQDGKYDEAVITYRGSQNLSNILNEPKEVWDDWIENDLPMQLANTTSKQVYQAIDYYETVLQDFDKENIHITGYSLGGGLGDVVSAYSGSSATTFNSASFLDVLYFNNPERMGMNFSGVDQWNFVDHINENDTFVGNWDKKLKPYMIYKHSVNYSSHSLASLVQSRQTDAGLIPFMAIPLRGFKPIEKMSNQIAMGSVMIEGTVDFGTSSNDKTSYPLAAFPHISYGGDGEDILTLSANNDRFVGGRGNDTLDGGLGDDSYHYWKEDAIDTIIDVGGVDCLYLYGYDKDSIRINYTDKDYIQILAENIPVVFISKNRFDTLTSFTIYQVEDQGGVFKYNKIDQILNSLLKYNPFASHYVLQCPIDIEILDPDGNVVHKINGSAESTTYKSFGHFYVFKDEEGEFAKIIDLAAGYSLRIIGTDTGTMDFSVQYADGKSMTIPVGAADIPITPNTIIEIVQDANGNSLLEIDTNGDGTIDMIVPLTEEILSLLQAEISLPDTGDASNLILWIMLAVCCISLSIAPLKKKRLN